MTQLLKMTCHQAPKNHLVGHFQRVSFLHSRSTKTCCLVVQSHFLLFVFSAGLGNQQRYTLRALICLQTVASSCWAYSLHHSQRPPAVAGSAQRINDPSGGWQNYSTWAGHGLRCDKCSKGNHGTGPLPRGLVSWQHVRSIWNAW